MRANFDTALTLVFVFSLAMTSEARSPRRNRNRAKARNSDLPTGAEEDGVCELEVTCPGGNGSPVSYPIKGPRRLARESSGKGKQGRKLPEKEDDRVEEADKSQNQNQNQNQTRVAFFAGLGKSFGPVDKNTDVLFDKVVTNLGGGFSEDTGRFTAPADGTYVFSLTIAAQGRRRAAVELSLNGRMVITVWAESLPYWATSSGTAILNLRTGDKVWLVLLQRAAYLYGYMYSTFSGYCLYQGV
ncbi:hypothetical protein RRG08_051770 [Elysia crispata]|uniref:C1q domain-containing protein n=1 Tax=Elysia crispata TaxID=231223 RepID=A0AAE1EAJ3_9GAST|nr:hypothetical protein RRG08_051770 [Elysia crispata]